MEKDYYEILEIDKKADKKTIKKAYRLLANKYHPDKNKSDPRAAEKFQEIQRAYETLSDDKKRGDYDLSLQFKDSFGEKGGQGFGSFGGFGGFGGFGRSQEQQQRGQQGFNHQDFEDLFRDLHKANRQEHKAKSPDHEELEVFVDIDKIVVGTNISIRNKNGQKINVKIPSTTKNGSKLRLKGKGSNGKDLILRVNYKNSDKAYIEGDKIILIHDLDVFKGFLGGEDIVQFFNKKIKLKINKLTQNNDRKAMPKTDFFNYKFFIELRINMPKTDQEVSDGFKTMSNRLDELMRDLKN